MICVALFAVAQASQPSFDFDLGLKPASAPVGNADLDTRITARRVMLQIHQGAGIAMLILMAGTMVLGQLNYVDRFMGGDSTARYELAHAAFAYTSFGLFAGTALLGIFAPVPFEKEKGIDQMTLHKVGMYGAAAGMIAQIVLGVVTRQQEGFLVQRDLAIAHLAIGYTTLALSALGVGAIVF